ncbi:cholera enterotoxin subunit A2 [Colletotrichum orchidophilum]|uniref:Cholera enterotoxin subunit A2 n=1 Tax=Colletotrichum orchidophilum TaxID=1209926 RepID=A0A1G4B051_9PEZI|nr:cholera enterotoxin subunit A2 [Colletotrichum orchidophilum]OHE94761.1 cholera enterotoxin subunit A2 [Colletotrichum orchidophilum]
MAGQQLLVLGLTVIALWAFLFYGLDLYRADSRPYSDIQISKGFLPKGQSTFGVATADTSLWIHVKGASNGFSKDKDGYVSTNSDRNLAESWINLFLHGNGYEAEFAALGGIKGSQTIGWAPVRSGVRRKEDLNYHERSVRDLFQIEKSACWAFKSSLDYVKEYLDYVDAICQLILLAKQTYTDTLKRYTAMVWNTSNSISDSRLEVDSLERNGTQHNHGKG